MFENCKHFFSPTATEECLKKDVYNLNITIKASYCDGIVECKFGEDEAFCSVPDYYLLIAIPLVAILNSLMAFIMWKSTIKFLQPISLKKEMNEEEFEAIHTTDSMRTIMNEVQGLADRELLNNKFHQMEINKHNGLYSETICCIKVR